MIGKPTPTQAEADAHARGEHVEEHEWDGSPLDITSHPVEEREALAKKFAGRAAPAPKVEESPKVEEPAKVEEKAAEPESHRASYKTRRLREEDK